MVLDDIFNVSTVMPMLLLRIDLLQVQVSVFFRINIPFVFQNCVFLSQLRIRIFRQG